MTAYTGVLVLDSEGVSKAAAEDRRVAAMLAAARENEWELVVSAVTLAEVLRGHPRDSTGRP